MLFTASLGEILGSVSMSRVWVGLEKVGGGQVRLGNLDSVEGCMGFPGCIHLENPRFSLTKYRVFEVMV